MKFKETCSNLASDKPNKYRNVAFKKLFSSGVA